MDESLTVPSFMDVSSETRVGRFTFRPATEAWTWSDGMFRIHGFEPGEVVPTTELVLRHIHPDDVESAHVARARALESEAPFTFAHRIRDARGRQRIVVVVGQREDLDGEPVLVGHLVDLTDFRQDAVRAELDQAVQYFRVQRSVIEQAKGVLMQLYSIDADTAWQLLRVYSQGSNLKVRELADLLIEGATGGTTPSKESLEGIDEVLDRLLARRRSSG